MSEWIVKCRCGKEFNLRNAKWCEHRPIFTKLCPNGHCICHKLVEVGVWRRATPFEQIHGFTFMLKEQHGGKRKKRYKLPGPPDRR